MASDAVMTFTDEGFQADVLDSDVPVLVDFWAEWCQPCKMLTPKEVAVSRNIQSIPTILIFKGGEVAETFVGITPKDKMTQALDAAM